MYLYIKMMGLKITTLDHVVFNVSDAQRSVDFYAGTLGLEPVRVEEFRAGLAPFPSVRINRQTILDFFPPSYHKTTPGGNNVNHIALAVDEPAGVIAAFLRERGVEVVRQMTDNFAARGIAEHAFHVHDPDGNLIELHTYGD